MEHYVCTGGCDGSGQAGSVCQAEGCPKKDQPMEKCECADGQHGTSSDTTGQAQAEMSNESPVPESAQPEEEPKPVEPSLESQN